MDIQQLLDAKTIVPVSDLTSVATNRSAFGDDVVNAFTRQIELRSTAALTVLTEAEKAGRDALLASEQRSYDGHIRERDSLLSLQQAVERRTAEKGFVPPTQGEHAKPDTRSGPPPAVLKTETRMAAWLEQRGGYAFADDRGADTMRLGAIVAAMASGNRSRLTDLEKRALSEGTDSAGGFTVPEVVASRFIDRVRDVLVVQKAGAQIVPMTSDTLNMARVAQPGIFLAAAPTVNAATGAWKLENDIISESGLVLERVTLSAHTLPLLLKMSVELFEDSVNISEIVEQEMAASTALELDRVALVGAGTAPEPRGIVNQAGVLTGAALGTPTNWDFLITAMGQLWAVNEEPNAAIYGTALGVTLAKFKSTADAQPLTRPSALAGVKEFRSAAAAAKLYLGDFTQLLIGMRTSFRLEVSREGAGAFERLQIAVRSYVRADIAVARPKAFVVLS